MQGYEQNLRYEKQDWLEGYQKTARVAWRLLAVVQKRTELPTEVSLWGSERWVSYPCNEILRV
jgi:hypothetical protein